LAGLTLDVFKVYEIRSNLREEARVSQGIDDENLGWVRIIRKDGVWGTTEPNEVNDSKPVGTVN
jgi:hypothetical protein